MPKRKITPVEQTWAQKVYSCLHLNFPEEQTDGTEQASEGLLDFEIKEALQSKSTVTALKDELNAVFTQDVAGKVADHFLAKRSTIRTLKLLERALKSPTEISEKTVKRANDLFDDAKDFGTRLTMEVFFEGKSVPEDPIEASKQITSKVMKLAEDADDDGISSITRSLNVLSNADNPVLKEAVALSLKDVHTNIVYPQNQRRKNAAQGGEVPRTPGEVTTNFLSLLKKEKQNPDLDQTASIALDKVDEVVRKQILGHQLSVPETRDILYKSAKELKDNGLEELAARAIEFSVQMGKSDEQPLTRLHDAVYSRVLDSNLVADLVHNPPQSVLDAGHTVKLGTLQTVSEQTPRVQQDLAKNLQSALQRDKRFWITECPQLQKLTDCPAEDAFKNLQDFLSAPTTNGYEAIAVPMLTVKLCVNLNNILTNQWPEDRPPVKEGEQDLISFIHKANKAYQLVHREANRRTAPGRLFGTSEVADKLQAGITLDYQPGAVTFEDDQTKIPSTHPSRRNIPVLEKPSQTQLKALKHGIPVASGVSGSTNLNLFFLKHLMENSDNENTVPDPKDYMLLTTMFLTYDGGHAIHEALWTGQYLDGELELNLGLEKTTPDDQPSNPTDYVSDLNDFIGLYDGTETGQALGRAKEHALDATVNYFDEHSYAAENAKDKA
ncbi:hypothetical protein ACMG4P_26360 [Pseudovibrio denitrificans]|uniref:hypothetical protein n=1 Tax=Pseudovibrio denitrificans TaxID=258256 RepID=UPI0039BF3AC1